jgi:tetratricopeptide (TPR) repeat protein
LHLVEQHPLYEAALQQLAYLLNECGQPHAALAYLQRALGLNPNSSRTLCETARCLAAGGDSSPAREHLQRALSLNPFYPLAWLRLLRLLKAQPDSDATRWAEQALVHYPESHVVALAALSLLPEEERLDRLGLFLTTCAPGPESEERAAAVAGFAGAIEETVLPLLGTREALDLLRRAARAFPESTRIALRLGQALDLAGETEEAQQHHLRALDLRRQAEVYRREFGPDEAPLRRCLVAAYTQKFSDGQPGMSEPPAVRQARPLTSRARS